jgi:hypothetical protein
MAYKKRPFAVQIAWKMPAYDKKEQAEYENT